MEHEIHNKHCRWHWIMSIGVMSAATWTGSQQQVHQCRHLSATSSRSGSISVSVGFGPANSRSRSVSRAADQSAGQSAEPWGSGQLAAGQSAEAWRSTGQPAAGQSAHLMCNTKYLKRIIFVTKGKEWWQCVTLKGAKLGMEQLFQIFLPDQGYSQSPLKNNICPYGRKLWYTLPSPAIEAKHCSVQHQISPCVGLHEDEDK